MSFESKEFSLKVNVGGFVLPVEDEVAWDEIEYEDTRRAKTEEELAYEAFLEHGGEPAMFECQICLDDACHHVMAEMDEIFLLPVYPSF